MSIIAKRLAKLNESLVPQVIEPERPSDMNASQFTLNQTSKKVGEESDINLLEDNSQYLVGRLSFLDRTAE